MATFEQMMDPQAFGMKECPHCNGYGSSLKDPPGVDRCTECHGQGLVPIPGYVPPPSAKTPARRINWAPPVTKESGNVHGRS